MKAFLEEFVLQAILSSKPEAEKEGEERIREAKEKPILFSRTEAGILVQKPVIKSILPQTPVPSAPLSPPSPSISSASTQSAPSISIPISIPFASQILSPTPTMFQPTAEFGRLSELIEDKNILMIECLPREKVKIKRKVNAGEQLEEADFSLSDEEILNIIKKFSEKTSKPLEKIFRASFQDMEVSAIISEEAGSRLLIRKTKR